MARRRIIELRPEFLTDLLRGWTALSGSLLTTGVTSDVPPDLRIIGCGWDEGRHVVRLAVESSTFDDVPDGMFAPNWEPAYTAHYMDRFEAAMEVLGRTAS